MPGRDTRIGSRASPLWGAVGGLLAAVFYHGFGVTPCEGRGVGGDVLCEPVYETLGVTSFMASFPYLSTVFLVAVGATLGWVGRRVRAPGNR